MAGNPASISAGIACLEVLKQPGVYEEFERLGALLEDGIRTAAAKHELSIQLNRVKGALAVYFTDKPVNDYETAQAADGELFARFFRLMLDEGICLAPSKYEAWFITTAHTEDDIRETIAAVDRSFAQMRK